MRLVVSLLLAVLLMPASLHAGSARETITSVRADFIQEKHLPILARPLISKGLLAFCAPDSLRWEYLEPVHSIMLMHDGKVEKFVERNGVLELDRQSGITSMQVILQDISNWLDGRFTDNPAFTTSQPDPRTVVLTPREDGLRSMISQIELKLGNQPGVMESVTIVEGPKALTRLTFSGTVLNQAIPASLFQK